MDFKDQIKQLGDCVDRLLFLNFLWLYTANIILVVSTTSESMKVPSALLRLANLKWMDKRHYGA
jgi:hypothetical protein